MAGLFQPYISYRQGTGTQIRNPGLQQPGATLNQSSLLLLIHGYNNTQAEASASYSLFSTLQNQLGTVTANLAGVYWPGSNWEGAAYYMQAIGQSLKVAPDLANDLYRAAQARKYLKIDIIAHSLGCRLALETIKQLLIIKNTDPSLGGLVIGQVVFMAGAVPTAYLEDINKLRPALSAFNSTLSLYSQDDMVLHWAFPVGESLAGEGFFPVALGRKNWSGGSAFGG